jgi:hypothetical protein
VKLQGLRPFTERITLQLQQQGSRPFLNPLSCDNTTKLGAEFRLKHKMIDSQAKQPNLFTAIPSKVPEIERWL